MQAGSLIWFLLAYIELQAGQRSAFARKAWQELAEAMYSGHDKTRSLGEELASFDICYI